MEYWEGEFGDEAINTIVQEMENNRKVATICERAVQHTDMGNVRFCRNLVESAVLSYAARAYGDDSANADKGFVLTDADFNYAGNSAGDKKASQIGFRV